MNKSKNKLFSLFKSPASNWLLLTALALAAVILLNLLISLLPASFTQLDMTSTGLTGLSDVSRDYVKGLEDKVTLHYICITGNEDESVRTMLDRYDELSDKLTVNRVDPAVHPSFISGYTDRELTDNSIIIESAKRRQVLDYYDLLVYNVYETADGSEYTPIGEMNHADFTTFFETYADAFSYGMYSYDVQYAGESAITSAIDYVVGDVLPNVYNVTGHGESALSATLLSYLSLDNVNCTDLSLPTVDSLPEDADCIILNAPQTDLSDKETTLLRDYLVGGGNVILLTDASAMKLTELMALMNEFGMKGSAGQIKEGNSNYHRTDSPYFLLPDTAGAEDLYALRSYDVLMPYAHPITMTECNYTMTYTSLFRTSDKALLEAIETDGDKTDEGTEGDVTDHEEPEQTTQVPVDGTTESKDEVDSTLEEDEPTYYDIGALVKLQTDQGSGKLCWLSSPLFLDSNYNNAVAGGNYTYFITILENMCEKKSSLAIAAKPMTDPSLVLTSGQAAFWAVLIIGLIPLSLPIIGIIIRERRRHR